MKLTKSEIDKINRKFNLNGYVVIRGLFDRKNILKAEEDLHDFLLIKKNSFKKIQVNYTKEGKINPVHNFSSWPWIKIFRKNKNLIKIIDNLLGKNAKDFGSELFAKPAKTGMPAPIHQDNYYWCIDNAQALTVWISLGVSNKKNGGIFYMNKSHKLGILEHKNSFAPGSSQKIKYPEGLSVFKKKFPSLKAGDCIIHHCLSVHGSEANKSKNPRVGCTLRYISNTSKIDLLMRSKYEKDLKLHFKKI